MKLIFEISLYSETNKTINAKLRSLCIPKWNPNIKAKGTILTTKKKKKT
jgi:hypothetical protein